jgi:hypothetical protein
VSAEAETNCTPTRRDRDIVRLGSESGVRDCAEREGNGACDDRLATLAARWRAFRSRDLLYALTLSPDIASSPLKIQDQASLRFARASSLVFPSLQSQPPDDLP